jgi:hypothetical protein
METDHVSQLFIRLNIRYLVESYITNLNNIMTSSFTPLFNAKLA